ncbi:hypothetical protein F511_28927 [Dorcoceras hygrometricum]|uniref:Uncharacterized protein n=1 Tax=Dorcoceras hygrometricum TaxID=472368 RepID=A0A2Z7BV04_9LAMI|nr:hypothetical protein F511_28927 [Dorcoceras hygrometricum]
MMNSRRICPADGSQYKDSAVGLVFMESAAGLAMKTSKVESAIPASAKERSESAGTGIEKPAGEIDQRRSFQTQLQVLLMNLLTVAIQEAKKNLAKIQTQRKNSAEAQSSSRHESAVKQLTIYERWMSTAELILNGINAQDGNNQWLRLSRANFQFKGTRFVLFWEIVQFTEEHCTEMERRQIGLDKRRTDLESI